MKTQNITFGEGKHLCPGVLAIPEKKKDIGVVLAHGAGAGMDSPFLEFFARGLGKRGYRVARFEYPYMASKRVTGKQKPPDRGPVLRETWLKVMEALKLRAIIKYPESLGMQILLQRFSYEKIA